MVPLTNQTYQQFQASYRETNGGDLSALGPALVAADFRCFSFTVGVHNVFVRVCDDGKNWVGIWRSGRTCLMQFTPISQQYLWYAQIITDEEFLFQKNKFIQQCNNS